MLNDKHSSSHTLNFFYKKCTHFNIFITGSTTSEQHISKKNFFLIGESRVVQYQEFSALTAERLTLNASQSLYIKKIPVKK